jgi:hypothetical protein
MAKLLVQFTYIDDHGNVTTESGEFNTTHRPGDLLFYHGDDIEQVLTDLENELTEQDEKRANI